ncbi:MAG: hypothetical protein ACE5FI_16305 [Anaerolineales bacterium]
MDTPFQYAFDQQRLRTSNDVSDSIGRLIATADRSGKFRAASHFNGMF